MIRRLYVGLVLAVLVGASGCGPDTGAPADLASGAPEVLAHLAVFGEPGDDRAILFAGDGFHFLDALTSPQYDPAMGLVVGGFRLLDGWRWWFPQDSVGLGAAEIASAVVRPDFAVRSYVEVDTAGALPRLIRRVRGPQPKSITEVISLGDGALHIHIPDSLGTIEFFPALSDRAGDGYAVEVAPGVLAIARDNYLEQRGTDPRPVWLAIAAEGARARSGRVDLTQRYPRAVGGRERSNAPGRLRLETPATITISWGMEVEEAGRAALREAARRDEDLRSRQQRLEEVLRRPGTIRTQDETFNRAFAWARLTLGQLVREDSLVTDLRPGLPGIEAQPGWNTIDALEGAFLATGEWERAAGMLRLYARNQRFDQRIDIFGRAPSRFDHVGNPRYGTADAGASLVAALGSYLRTTGHDGLVLGDRRLFWTNPVFTQRGYDDPRQMRSANGLISHAPNQTWVQQIQARREAAMRGPNAVEVQARYFDNLRTMQRLAAIMGVRRQAEAYADTAAVFQRRFERLFVRDDRIADFVDQRGQPADYERPSVLYALRSFDLGSERERRILRRVAETLVYPHGVSTRPQTDSLFYPFLDEPDYYEPAAARYDGTVWPVLSGPLISLLVEHGAPGRAAEQTAFLTRLVLERGVVGAIPENVDAHPREDHLGVGGAPVQPWTLAEYLRNAFQDYAGIRHQGGREVVLQPNIPASWGRTETAFRLGNGWVEATIEQSARELRVALRRRSPVPDGAVVRVRGFSNEKAVMLGSADQPARDSVMVVVSAGGVTVNGEEAPVDANYAVPDADFWSGFDWKSPRIPERYPVMQRLEEERRLTVDQVATINPTATVILARTDPLGDDWGPTATYTYPTGYPPQVLDATYLELSEDADAYYVRIEMAAMADDAELGFQPTFIALTLDVEEGGERVVGRNANYSFPAGSGYNYIVYVGDGFRVEDHRGRVLGEFATSAEIIDVASATIQFALPKFVVPSIPRGSNVTLLVGANDGSRSPGRFRSVGVQATSRQGGGRMSPGDPNVYDVVTSRVVR